MAKRGRGRPTTRQKTKDKIERQSKFLFAYRAARGDANKACEEAGIPMSTYRRWMQDEPDFRNSVKAMDLEVVYWLQSEVYRHIAAGDKKLLQWAIEKKIHLIDRLVYPEDFEESNNDTEGTTVVINVNQDE